MSHYKLRVDLSSELVPPHLMNLLEKYFTCYAWVLESGKDNPHFHVYGLSENYKAPAIRQSLRNFIQRKGDYSLAELKPNADQWKDGWPLHYLAYMHKENYVYAVNIPQEILDEAEKLSKTIGDLKKKKESQRELVERHLDSYFANKVVDWEKDPYEVNYLFGSLIRFLRENQLPIRRTMLTYWVDNYCVRFPAYANLLTMSMSDRHFMGRPQM